MVSPQDLCRLGTEPSLAAPSYREPDSHEKSRHNTADGNLPRVAKPLGFSCWAAAKPVLANTLTE
ncbi:MAG: hypothetical protein V3V82_01015, partial [Acidimicrobiia bacterium]